jgi:UDP-N-acetylmuramoyl-tripeptide--D-alanyl-D-alanine ligase
MRALTARQIAHIMDARLTTADPGQAFRAVTTDSRNIAPGALFVALKGDRFDGHDFAKAAHVAGAGGVVVSRPVDAPAGATVFQVADTQQALERLAVALRTLHPGRFIAVTGSVGKTSTKELLAAALSPFGKVGKTPGNYNNHIGVPLTLAALDGDEDFVVMELGMSAPGEIARLTHLARPDLGLVTRAEAVHLEFFDSVDQIADAKAELYEHLGPHALAVANADDARMLPRAQAFHDAPVTFGRAASAAVQIVDAHHTAAGLAIAIRIAGKTLDVTVPTLGLHMAENVAAALAAVHTLALDPTRAIAALATAYRPPPHRMALTALGTVQVLDDCYNANPAATRAALLTFAEVFAKTPRAHRLAVIGSMRELGPTAEIHHAKLGRLAGETAATVLATGPHAASLSSSATAAGAASHAADDFEALRQVFATWLQTHPNGVVLLKGSRGERLERALTPQMGASSGGALSSTGGGH